MIFHRVDGQGEPVLLLNGIAMTAGSWEAVAAPLAEDHAVIRCDLRGQLLSPGEPPADAAEHVDDVVEVLEHLDVGPVHVLGTSFGGVVAMLLAGRRPDLVRSLMVVAATDRFDRSMASGVRRWRQACLETLAGGDRGRLIDVLDDDVYSPGYLAAHGDEHARRRAQVASLPDAWFEGLAGLLGSAWSVDVTSRLGDIRCPTLLVAAGADAFIPRERMEKLADGIPGARLEVLEGAGHAAVVERPERLVELGRDHFRSA